MAGGINADRWATYMTDILRVLRPGGWCQMVEIYYNAQSDNGTLTDSMSSERALEAESYTDRPGHVQRPRTPRLVEELLAKLAAV